MINELVVEGYRSIRRARLPLSAVNVVVGANGSGKTNLYRALELLQHAAAGRLARALVDEGGMPSVTWAGPRADDKKQPVRVKVRAALDDLTWQLELGLVSGAVDTVFKLDPEVKDETVGKHGSSQLLVERHAQSAWLRDRAEGERTQFGAALSSSESVLSQLRDSKRWPEAASLRDRVLAWRFYHHFRTDPQAPVRSPQPGVRTPALAADGADLAAAIETIREIGDRDALREAIAAAFPGARLRVDVDAAVRMVVQLSQPGLLRPLAARELSDGTLRYLCLVAALLSPRPPEVLALNEPETSLHPELLPPLAKLIALAGATSQIVLTTHSQQLAAAIAEEAKGGARVVELALVEGETRLRTEGPVEDDFDVMG